MKDFHASTYAMSPSAIRENWWTRPCGPREVLRLALPMVVATGSWTLMHFIDRMFLLWFSRDAMAAAMPAGMLSFTIVCFPMGLAAYVNTFVAQYHGAKRPERIGVALWQGIRVGVIATPLFLLVVPLAPYFFSLAGHDNDMVRLETVYLQILAFGSGAAVFSAALSSFFTGRGQMRVVMLVNIASALLNIALDYCWIFGHAGFPEWGIAGAAWATVVSQWLKVVVFWWLINAAEEHRAYQLLAGRRYDADLWRRLLKFGGVNGLQMLIEVSAFTIFVLLVGGLGKDAMAATTLAFSVNSVAFVPMIGVGIAVTTLVGQQLGANRPDLATRGTWTAFSIAAVYTGSFAALYLFWPDLLLMGHAMGTDPKVFAGLRDTTVVLLRFVAAYCVLDAANVIFVSVLKGAGDTRFILGVSAVASPLPVLIGWLGIRFGGLGLFWCWSIVTAWICSLGLIYLGRFVQGSWKTMRVIEPDIGAKGLGVGTEGVVPPAEPAIACSGIEVDG